MEGLSLMSNRLKEAEIFASGAPGYWQVFQAPDPRNISPSSLVKMPAALGVASGLLGAGLTTLLTLLVSQRSSRRSVLECCAATKAPLISHIPATTGDDAQAAIAHFWLTHLAPHFTTHARILFWTPALDPAVERQLWTLLATAAWEDTGKPIRVHDLSPDDLWDGDEACPAVLEWLSFAPATAASSAVAATLLRAAALPQGAARVQLATVDYWIAIVAGRQDSLRRAVKFRPLSDAYLPPCNGTVAWTESPQGAIRQAADVVSCILVKRFS